MSAYTDSTKEAHKRKTWDRIRYNCIQKDVRDSAIKAFNHVPDYSAKRGVTDDKTNN